MKRRGFFKVLGALGLAPVAVRASFGDGGIREVPGIDSQYAGEFWETLTTGLNDQFYSVLHRPSGIRMNLNVPPHMDAVQKVGGGMRRTCMDRILAEIERRKLYGGIHPNTGRKKHTLQD